MKNVCGGDLAAAADMRRRKSDGKDNNHSNWDPTLFVNRVEVRENSKGEKKLFRSVGCEFLKAASKQEMEDKIGAFMLQEDVRLLAKGLDANDPDLPREEKNPAQDVIDGTADIYQLAEEPK